MTPEQSLHAIERLLRRYARLNDEARWDELAQLFTEDGRFVRPTDPGNPIVGRDAVLQSFLARPKGAARRHLVANPEIELLADGTARATCWTVLLTAQAPGGGSVTVGGFDDELVRTPEGWRFRSRTGFTCFDPVPFALRAGATDPWSPVPQPSN